MSPFTRPNTSDDDPQPGRWTLSPGRDSWSQVNESLLMSSPRTRRYQVESEEISKRQEEQDPDFSTSEDKGKRPAFETPTKRKNENKTKYAGLSSTSAIRTGTGASSYTKCSAAERAQRDEHLANIRENWGKTGTEIVPDVLVPRQQTKSSTRPFKRIAPKNWATTILENLEQFSWLSADQCEKAHHALLKVRKGRQALGADITICEAVIRDARHLYKSGDLSLRSSPETPALPKAGASLYHKRLSPASPAAGPSLYHERRSPTVVELDLVPEAFPGDEGPSKNNDSVIAGPVLQEIVVEKGYSDDGPSPALQASAQDLLENFASDGLNLEHLDRMIDQAYKMRVIVAKIQLRIDHLDAQVDEARSRQNMAHTEINGS